MMQQIESSGMAREGGTSSGGSSVHAKSANKGLFGKILALVGKGPTDNKSSQEQAPFSSGKGRQDSPASSAKKPARLSPHATVLADAQKTRKPSGPDGKHATLFMADTAAMATITPSARNGNSRKGFGIEGSHATVLADAQKTRKPSDPDGKHAALSIAVTGTTAMGTPIPSGASGKTEKPEAGEHAPLPGLHGLKQATQKQMTPAELLAHGNKAKAGASLPSTGKGNAAKPHAAADAVSARQGSTTVLPHKAEHAEGSLLPDGSLPPYSGDKIKTTDSRRPVIAHNVNGGGAASDKPTMQRPAIHSGEHTNTTAIHGNRLHAANPESQQQDPATLPLSEKREAGGNQTASPNRVQRDAASGRAVSANQEVIAGHALSNGKGNASQAKTVSATGTPGAGKRIAAKGKATYLDPITAHKSHARNALPQLGSNPTQHAPGAPRSSTFSLNGTIDGMIQMDDRMSSNPGKHMQSVSESHGQQALAGDSMPSMLSQIGKPVLHQASPISGPWSVASAMQEIGHAASQERFRLELNLDPAHLGKIKVYLDSDAKHQIQVHLVVDQNASRQVIEQHLPNLRQALAQHGLDMGGFSMASQQDQGGHGFSSSQQRQSDYATPAGSNSVESPASASISPSISPPTANGRISIRV